jgi:hypothetical protein
MWGKNTFFVVFLPLDFFQNFEKNCKCLASVLVAKSRQIRYSGDKIFYKRNKYLILLTIIKKNSKILVLYNFQKSYFMYLNLL